MADSSTDNGFVTDSENEEPLSAKGTNKVTRFYPIDSYEIAPELLGATIRHHFLRVPVLGQFNPLACVPIWCGRTSASMVWNYYQRALGKAKGKTDYITHWCGKSGSLSMDLRHPRTEAKVFLTDDGGCWPLRQLKEDYKAERLGPLFPSEMSNDNTPVNAGKRRDQAAMIHGSLSGQLEVFAPIIEALSHNNPVVLFTGFSPPAFGGHIICVCGFCELPDRDGSPKLWLLVADPASPMVASGPKLTAVCDKPAQIGAYLGRLQEGENSRIPVIEGSWLRARGYLYLVRANKFFEYNTNKPERKAIWLDDLLNGTFGGLYIVKPTPTPLDPTLVYTKNVLSGICFPFQDNPYVLASPASYYRLAEGARDGFYPIGTNRALHGGIHLPSPAGKDQDAAIRSIATGYVVAARLARRAPDRSALEFISDYNGFVLVRHELVVKGQRQTGDEAPSGQNQTPVPFYSLYMHMPPTTWPSQASDSFGNIPWLQRFYLARHGALINLDPNAGSVGERMWVAVPTDPENVTETMVHAANNDIGKLRQVKLRDGKRPLSYFRKPRANLAKGTKALEAGAVVTFAEPFLVVNQGDPLGLVRADSDDRTAGRLHWQIFAPAGTKNALDEVRRIAKEIAKEQGMGFSLPEVSEASDDKNKIDNLIEDDELDRCFKDKLAKGEAPAYAELLDVAKPDTEHEHFRKALRSFMEHNTAFAAGLDQGPLIEPMLPGNIADRAIDERAYPLTLIIDMAKYPVHPSAARPAPYTLTISYYRSKKDREVGCASGVARVSITENQLKGSAPVKLKLKVPAEAQIMSLSCDSLYLDPDSPKKGESTINDEPDLARSLFGARWRAVSLKHVTEWSPGGLQKLIPKLRKKMLLPQSLNDAPSDQAAVAVVLPTSWYGIPRGNADKPSIAEGPVEIPVLGQSGQEPSLFAGQSALLPATDIPGYHGCGEIINEHPVTFLWLLRLAQASGHCELLTKFTAISDDARGNPAFWGFGLPSTAPVRVGNVVTAVVIHEDWCTGPVTMTIEQQRGPGVSSSPYIVEGDYSDGVCAKQVAVTFWGQWKLGIQGYHGSPKTQGNTEAPIVLDVAPPNLVGSFEPKKDPKTGIYSVELHFTENCPVALHAVLTFEHAVVTLPSAAEVPQVESWLVDEETGAYIVRQQNGYPKIAGRFALSEYLGSQKVEDSLKKVSIDVVVGVARYREACGVRLRVVDLSEDGRTATLEPVDATTLDSLNQGTAQPNVTITPAKVPGSAKFTIVVATTRPAIPLKFQPAQKCAPVCALRLDEDTGAWQCDGPFIVGLKRGTEVTSHFKWHEYKDVAAQSSPKVSRYLASQLEALWLAHKKASGVDLITILGLAPDGLSVAVGCPTWTTKKAGFEACARNLKAKVGNLEQSAFSDVKLGNVSVVNPKIKPDQEALLLTVTMPLEDTSGTLRFEFDPSDIFGWILGEASPSLVQRALIRATFAAINGYHVNVIEGPTRSIGEPPAGLDAPDTLKAKLPGIFKSLAKPGFAAICLSLSGQNLVARALLQGKKSDWDNAAPTFSVENVDQPVKPVQSNKGANAIELTLPLVTKKKGVSAYAGKTFSLEAHVTNRDATFDGERITIGNTTKTVNATPSLTGPLTVSENSSGVLHFKAAVHCCTSDVLKLTCVNATDQQPSKSCFPKAKTGTLVNKAIRNAQVTSDGLDGVFEAELDKGHLSAGETFEFILDAADASGAFGIPVTPRTCFYTAAPATGN